MNCGRERLTAHQLTTKASRQRSHSDCCVSQGRYLHFKRRGEALQPGAAASSWSSLCPIIISVLFETTLPNAGRAKQQPVLVHVVPLMMRWFVCFPPSFGRLGSIIHSFAPRCANSHEQQHRCTKLIVVVVVVVWQKAQLIRFTCNRRLLLNGFDV